MELLLVTPRILFSRIQPVFDGQNKLKGNIVNVPLDTMETFESLLPRDITNTKVIQLKFMRRMDYKRPYKYGIVNLEKVYRALKYLVNKPLFNDNDIKLKNFDNSKLPFITNKEDQQNYIRENIKYGNLYN